MDAIYPDGNLHRNISKFTKNQITFHTLQKKDIVHRRDVNDGLGYLTFFAGCLILFTLLWGEF